MNEATKLSVKNLNKTFTLASDDRFSAVSDLSFSVYDREFFTLLGPSGCGKSTLLRMIAGLEQPDSGCIQVDQNIVYSDLDSVNQSASNRKMGMVFQSFAIWPHMSVLKNVMFPLEVLRKSKGWSYRDIEEKAHAMLQVVALDDISKQRAASLSGGQKQRLALARAIVAEPQLILLDEPLSNLDAKLRERLRADLKSLQMKLGIAFIYVTHDQDEALSLSDRIAVMDSGKILQIGTPEDIYRRPTSEFVAKFVGKGTMLESIFWKQSNSAEHNFVRPEDIKLSTTPLGSNWVKTRVLAVEYYGDHRDVVVALNEKEVKIRVGVDTTIEVGNEAFLMIDANKTICLPKG